MPYDSRDELPDQVVDNLPSHAQDIYKEAYNSAYEHYEDSSERDGDASREEVAHRVAWSAVKSKCEKNDSGGWVQS